MSDNNFPRWMNGLMAIIAFATVILIAINVTRRSTSWLQ